MAEPIQMTFARREIKYFITPAQRDLLKQALAPYTVPDLYGPCPISSIYYDTEDWRLIRASIEKPEYKEKLRVRSYGIPGETDPVFIEIKKKYRGTVYKRRIVTAECLIDPILSCLLTDTQSGQIDREIQWFQQFYRAEPKVFIGYDREALAGREEPEVRLTFDTNLRFRTTSLGLSLEGQGQALLPDDRVLMEVKLPGACPLWLARALSEHKIRPVSFSKYGTRYQQFILPQAAAQYKETFHIA